MLSMHRFLSLVLILLTAGIILPTTLKADDKTPKLPKQAQVLQNQLKRAANDTSRIHILNRLGFLLRKSHRDLANNYLEESRELINKTGFEKGKIWLNLAMGWLEFSTGKNEKAFQLYAKGYSISRRYHDSTAKFLLSNSLGQVMFYMDEKEEAKRYWNISWRLVPGRPDTSYGVSLSMLYRQIAVGYQFLEKTDSAFYAYNLALKALKGKKDYSGKSIIYSNISVLYDEAGDFDKTLEYAIKAVEYADSSNIPQVKGSAYNNMGNAYDNKGEYPKAVSAYLIALREVEKVDHKRAISLILNNIGEMFHLMGDLNQALEYNNRSLAMKESLNFQEGIATTLNNISAIYLVMEDTTKAAETALRALSIFQALKDTSNLAASKTALGNLEMKKENYKAALKHFEEGMQLIKAVEGREKIVAVQFAKIQVRLGAALHKNGRSQEALKYLLPGYEWAEKNGSRQYMKDAAEVLADVYEARGEYEKAFEYHQIYKAQSDSLLNAENIKKITLQEYQYQTEQEKAIRDSEQKRKEAIQSAELKRQKTIRNAFIIGFILMIIMAGLIYRNYHLNRIANKKLKAQNTLIKDQKEKIEYLNGHLENQVKKRTKELEKRNDQLVSYAFMNAHQVRGPLSRMLGLFEVNRIEAFNSESERDKMLHDLERSANELDQVINDINTQLED